MAGGVAEENPGFGAGIVGVGAVLGPLGHLGGEDVEMAVAIDVGDLQTVAMDDFFDEDVRRPRFGVLGIGGAVVPGEGADAVAAVNDALGRGGGVDRMGGGAVAPQDRE